MAPFLATPVRQLSLGQRMRGEVAAALLHRPELLVLDEPTIGLDLASKERLRDVPRRPRRRGTTLLLTTHDLPDVERLCRPRRGDRPRPGARRRPSRGAAGPLRRRAGGGGGPGRARPPLAGLPGVHDVTVEAGGLRQRLAFAPADTTAAAVIAAVAERAALRDVAVVEPSIEGLWCAHLCALRARARKEWPEPLFPRRGRQPGVQPRVSEPRVIVAASSTIATPKPE